jgi:hypothetical protein
MDLGFGPDEWLGVFIGFNEVIYVLPELFDRGVGLWVLRLSRTTWMAVKSGFSILQGQSINEASFL